MFLVFMTRNTPRTFKVTYDIQAFSVTEKGHGQKLKVKFLSRII